MAARRYEHLAWARALGYGAEHTSHLAGWLCGYDLVVNTVPARVLGQAELADLKPDCLVLDLASKPGGVDLEEAARLCELLRDREVPLAELDAQGVLEEMERLEQSGAAFQDKQRQDVRIRYVAPVVISAVMVALLAALIALMLWAFYLEPANSPPLALVLVIVAVPALIIAGVVLALFQRIREIGKGEIDDAKKY